MKQNKQKRERALVLPSQADDNEKFIPGNWKGAKTVSRPRQHPESDQRSLPVRNHAKQYLASSLFQTRFKKNKTKQSYKSDCGRQLSRLCISLFYGY